MSLCSSFKSNSDVNIDHRTPLPDELGFLILSDKGAILNSGGQLTKDERTARIFTSMHKVLKWFGDDSAFGDGDKGDSSLNHFNSITVRFDGHFYTMSRGLTTVQVIKRQLTGVLA